MQRIGVGVLVAAAAAVVMWVTLAPDRDEAGSGRAPAVSSGVDAVGRVVGPPLVFGKPRPPVGEPHGAQAVVDEAAVAESALEETSREPRTIAEVDPMTGSGGGSSPSRTGAEGRRPIPGVDGPSAPSDPLTPPSDLPPDAPSDVPDPVGSEVDAAELADLEAEVAEMAEAQGLVDPHEANVWAREHVDPNSPPTQQQQQFEEARNEFIATRAMSLDLVQENFGPNLPPNEQAHRAAVGDRILSLQPPEFRMERLKEMLDEAPEPGGARIGVGDESGSRMLTPESPGDSAEGS